MPAQSEPFRTTLSLFGARRSKDKAFRTFALMWLSGIALLSVPMVTLIDVPIARWFSNNPLPGEVTSALELARVLSHGGGICLILASMMLMAPRCRWQVPRLAALAMGGGAVATIAKMFVLRPRPNEMNLEIATYDSAWLWAFDWKWEQVATFDASTRAFPSGSIATATAFSVGLWVVLPRGRWLFAFLCIGALIQRLYCGSHFLSDLFGGAAFGLLWAYACFSPRLLGKLFDEMEPKSRRGSRPKLQRVGEEPATVNRAAEESEPITEREPKVAA
jgi:membrane-associated phospholipid phosphatase